MRCRRSARGAGPTGWGGRWPRVAAVAVLWIAGVPLSGAHAGSLPSAGAKSPSPWSMAQRSEEPGAGFVLYTRPVPESDFDAVRLEAEIDAPPGRVADAFSKNITDPQVVQAHTQKTVLRDDGDVVLVYSYVEMPLVSDRDVVTRTERVTDPDEAVQRFEWHATDEGPAPLDGVVRLEKSSGYWEFRPLPGDRTFAVYESHADIGGSIPGWLVNRLMQDTVVDNLDALRERVARESRDVASGQPSTGSKSR